MEQHEIVDYIKIEVVLGRTLWENEEFFLLKSRFINNQSMVKKFILIGYVLIYCPFFYVFYLSFFPIYPKIH